jgi:hypothetical protein
MRLFAEVYVCFRLQSTTNDIASWESAKAREW